MYKVFGVKGACCKMCLVKKLSGVKGVGCKRCLMKLLTTYKKQKLNTGTNNPKYQNPEKIEA